MCFGDMLVYKTCNILKGLSHTGARGGGGVCHYIWYSTVHVPVRCMHAILVILLQHSQGIFPQAHMYAVQCMATRLLPSNYYTTVAGCTCLHDSIGAKTHMHCSGTNTHCMVSCVVSIVIKRLKVTCIGGT